MGRSRSRRSPYDRPPEHDFSIGELARRARELHPHSVTYIIENVSVRHLPVLLDSDDVDIHNDKITNKAESIVTLHKRIDAQVERFRLSEHIERALKFEVTSYKLSTVLKLIESQNDVWATMKCILEGGLKEFLGPERRLLAATTYTLKLVLETYRAYCVKRGDPSDDDQWAMRKLCSAPIYSVYRSMHSNVDIRDLRAAPKVSRPDARSVDAIEEDLKAFLQLHGKSSEDWLRAHVHIDVLAHIVDTKYDLLQLGQDPTAPTTLIRKLAPYLIEEAPEKPGAVPCGKTVLPVASKGPLNTKGEESADVGKGKKGKGKREKGKGSYAKGEGKPPPIAPKALPTGITPLRPIVGVSTPLDECEVEEKPTPESTPSSEANGKGAWTAPKWTPNPLDPLPSGDANGKGSWSTPQWIANPPLAAPPTQQDSFAGGKGVEGKGKDGKGKDGKGKDSKGKDGKGKGKDGKGKNCKGKDGKGKDGKGKDGKGKSKGKGKQPYPPVPEKGPIGAAVSVKGNGTDPDRKPDDRERHEDRDRDRRDDRRRDRSREYRDRDRRDSRRGRGRERE